MRIYIATVKVRGTSAQKVEISARDSFAALALLRAQYGRDAVSNVHVRPSDHRRSL